MSQLLNLQGRQLWLIGCLVICTLNLYNLYSESTLRPDSTPPKQFDQPSSLFTLVFDDGNDSDFFQGLPILSEYGAVACSAIITGKIGHVGYLTTDQIYQLRDAGWEIMSHTVTHPNLKTLSRDQLDQELAGSLNALRALGLDVHNIVYPYNRSSRLVWQEAARWYRSGRGGQNLVDDSRSARFLLTSFRDRDQLTTVEQQIDAAAASGKWYILYHHRIQQKIWINQTNGKFRPMELLKFYPSGATGTFIPTMWYGFGATLIFSPIEGNVTQGDTITGESSGATARVDKLGLDERTYLRHLLEFIKHKHRAMRIVTVDQGLDILGVPAWNKPN